jgi:hypothetical protein
MWTDGKRALSRELAWTEHFKDRGCHPIRARRAAQEKVRETNSWPTGRTPIVPVKLRLPNLATGAE